MIDPKDLRKIMASEFKVGAHHYVRSGNSWAHLQVFEDELKDDRYREEYRMLISEACKDGRMFIRISKPYQSFVDA